MNLKHSLNKVWHSNTQKVMSLTVFGMILSFIMDIAIAAKLGTSQTADSLILALTLPIMLDTIVRESTKFSLVPLFMERKMNLNRRQFEYFISGLCNFGFLIGIVITILIEFLAPVFIPFLTPNLSSEGQAQTAFLLQVCAPLVIFVPNTTVLSVLLNSQKNFATAALRHAVVRGLVVFAILVYWQSPDIGYMIAASHVVGFLIFFLMLYVENYRSGFRYQWLAFSSLEDIKQLGTFASYPTLGFALGQASRLVERLLASMVAVGGVSAYYYALRIFSSVQTVIGVSIATTSLPAMTEQNLAGNQERLTTIIRKNVLNALKLALPITLMIVLFNRPIISLLYQRGAFDAAAVDLTSQILFWLGLGLTFNCCIPLLQSVFYAQQRYRDVFCNMLILVIINLGLAWLLSETIGLIGISIALSVAVAVAAANVVLMLRRLGIYVIPQLKH